MTRTKQQVRRELRMRDLADSEGQLVRLRARMDSVLAETFARGIAMGLNHARLMRSVLSGHKRRGRK